VNAIASFTLSSGEDAMPIADLMNWLSASKTALDIFKGIRNELPQGPKTDEAQKQIEKAELALKSSEAELAKALGYHLCQCTFPPQAMLWREQEKVFRCPNPQCGRTVRDFNRPIPRGSVSGIV
jgi:hypothetical protein